MAANTPQPDNTTQLLGFAAALLAAIAAVINRLPKRGKRKIDTDELSALGELVKRDASIEDLTRKLTERETELQRLEKQVVYLKPFENQAVTLAEVNQGLQRRLDELERKPVNDLEKEVERLNAELATLRKLPTRKIEPPGDTQPIAPPSES